MSMMNMVLKVLFQCVLLLHVVQLFVLADDDDDEVSCVDIAMEDLKTCKDWESAPCKFDVKLALDDNHHGTLNGKLVVNHAITEGVEISLIVMLITPNGEELVYSIGADLCQSMEDKEAVWAPIVEALNTTCPINVGEYNMMDVKFNLQGLKPMMTRDYIGQYSITMSIELAVQKFMCVLLIAEILEETRLRSECPNPQKD